MSRRSPDKPSVVILGAGPAGLGSAYRLAREGIAEVTLIERSNTVGGNSGSFVIDGINVDYGSHRLHPACHAKILGDIRDFLGDELLNRPRHGRIRLLGKWIHFPLKPLDLALHLPPRFSISFARDMLHKTVPFGRERDKVDSFASILEAKLGRTIANDFYLPYAAKIWGLEPEQLSAIQARRRVSADSPAKLLRKVLSAVPGLRPQGAGRFYYPRCGFGQIGDAYLRAAEDAGARVVLGATVRTVEQNGERVARVVCDKNGSSETYDADHIWSTIPITNLVRFVRPSPPPDILEAASQIEFRAMILVYMVLRQGCFTPFDAHYFPESGVPVTRISEPKNYCDNTEPAQRTVICAELPCSREDATWEMSDHELGELVRQSLRRSDLPLNAPVERVVTRRLAQAYPIYRKGYERAFGLLDSWLGTIPNLLSFGRQGLFAHDNTHHALYMAYSAVDCLSRDGHFDRGRWNAFRTEFESHVVED